MSQDWVQILSPIDDRTDLLIHGLVHETEKYLNETDAIIPSLVIYPLEE